MPLNVEVKKRIIKKLINNQDYRDEVMIIIDEIFLDYCVDFFKKVANAKLENQSISIDWYKETFLDDSLSKKEIAINSGLNMKSIENSYNSVARNIVIEASNNNYDRLVNTIDELIQKDESIRIKLTISLRDVSIDLTVNESLIVINTIAVKRAEIRGSMWSAVGKQIEKKLMIALCLLFNVPHECIDQTDNPDSFREVDFYLLDNEKRKLKVEVKLMGKGNPESADAIFARQPQLFIADKLSKKNMKQADDLNIKWIQLREGNGYQKFLSVLKELDIPHVEFDEDLDSRLNIVLEEAFKET